MTALCLELLRCHSNLTVGTIFKNRWSIDRPNENCAVHTANHFHFCWEVQQVDMTVQTALYRHSLTTDANTKGVKLIESIREHTVRSYPSIEPGGLINRELTTPEMTFCWGNTSSVFIGAVLQMWYLYFQYSGLFLEWEKKSLLLFSVVVVFCWPGLEIPGWNPNPWIPGWILGVKIQALALNRWCFGHLVLHPWTLYWRSRLARGSYVPKVTSSSLV